MFDITQLVGIPQLGVLSSLERLIEVFQEAAALHGQKVPVVSVYLKSGQYIQGYLICFNSGPEKKSVMIANYRTSEVTSQDLTYILVDEIAGFTVHEADSIVDHLSSGQINLSLPKTPSLEEIHSHLQKLVRDFNGQMGAQVTAELMGGGSAKAELEALYFCVTDWIRALRKYSQDEIAQQSFKENAYKFIFKFGPVAKIENLNGREFHLVIGKENEKYVRISRFAIEAFLKEIV